MKDHVISVCALGCLLLSCKGADVGAFVTEVGTIDKIELVDERDVTFGSMDSAKIGRFVSFLSTAGEDNAGRDFTSNDFIRFHGANGKTFQIEIFKNLFKAKGKTFVADSDIIKRMKAIFDDDALIETPAPNWK